LLHRRNPVKHWVPKGRLDADCLPAWRVFNGTMEPFVADDLTRVTLNDDACFLFPPGDVYWDRSSGLADYESEIDWVLRRTTQWPYAMLDAGANYGYWSVLASSSPYGSHLAVAVEPSPRNFEILSSNARANGDRFRTLRRACFDESDRRVALYGNKHYGLSLRRDWHPNDIASVEEVETITLDDVANLYLPNRPFPPFVKIDVEGSEASAIQGARRLIAEGALIAYEDHGKDRAHPSSRLVLALDGVDLWYLPPDRRPMQIETIEQIAAIKIDPVAGYNFFACRHASPWARVFEG
jgi:FkbM family methyltransferase